MVVDQAAGQGERQGDGVVRHLRGAVIGHVAHQHAVARGGGAVDPVVADAHPHHGAQLGETREISRAEPVAEDHQAVGRFALGVGQVGERVGVAHDDPGAGAENSALLPIVRIHSFRIQYN